MEVNELQEENASFSIVVTSFGMEIVFKEEQPENAKFPIDVIPSLITTFFICFLFEDQGVVGYPLFHL